MKSIMRRRARITSMARQRLRGFKEEEKPLNFLDRELARAVASGNADMVESLLNAGADANAVSDAGSLMLMEAIEAGNTDIMKLLLKADADPDKKDPSGMYPMELVVYSGYKKELSVLIKSGADVDIMFRELSLSGSGKGRLLPRGGKCGGVIAAAKGGELTILRMLLKAGADINKCDEAGYGVLARVVFMMSPDRIGTERTGEDIEYDDSGNIVSIKKWTRYRYDKIKRKRYLKIIEFLLKNGAKKSVPSGKDIRKFTSDRDVIYMLDSVNAETEKEREKNNDEFYGQETVRKDSDRRL